MTNDLIENFWIYQQRSQGKVTKFKDNFFNQ